MDVEAASQDVNLPLIYMCLDILALVLELPDWRSPSPTSSWYSGPVGLVKTLFVSIIGAA